MKTKNNNQKEASERSSAEERRIAVLNAAVSEFAAKGWNGASTEDIARRVQISQPYVMRLFGSKKELFIATVELVYQRIQQLFQVALEDKVSDPLTAMGNSYAHLLAQREELLLLLQSFAATDDAAIKEVVRRCFTDLYNFVATASKASDTEVRRFFADGIFSSVVVAMDLPFLLTDHGGHNEG